MPVVRALLPFALALCMARAPASPCPSPVVDVRADPVDVRMDPAWDRAATGRGGRLALGATVSSLRWSLSVSATSECRGGVCTSCPLSIDVEVAWPVRVSLWSAVSALPCLRRLVLLHEDLHVSVRRSAAGILPGRLRGALEAAFGAVAPLRTSPGDAGARWGAVVAPVAQAVVAAVSDEVQRADDLLDSDSAYLRDSQRMRRECPGEWRRLR